MADCNAATPPESNSELLQQNSQVVQGQVTAIVDGDTLHLNAENIPYVVDLAGIDAPEKGQPFGDMAAQVLYLKTFQREVNVLVLPDSLRDPAVQRVIPRPKPEASPATRAALRQRICGIIYCKGCVNSQLVLAGMAWHAPQSCPSSTLAQAQESARNGRRGLWQAEEQPVPPWLWLTRQRKTNDSSFDPPGPPLKVPDLSRYFEADTPPAVVEASLGSQPAISDPSTPLGPTQTAAGSYWLTASSGIRHNSDCRYYGKSKGRPCTSSEGRPCQKCGG